MSDVHTVTISGASLTAALWPASPAMGKQAAAQVGAWLHDVVEARVFDQGRDAHGSPFKGYSPRYRDWKLKRRGGHISGPEVNLQLTGALRRNFRVKGLHPRGGQIGPAGRVRAYAVHVDARRPFIEASKGELDRLPEIVVRVCERLNGATTIAPAGPGAGGRIA